MVELTAFELSQAEGESVESEKMPLKHWRRDADRDQVVVSVGV